MVFGLSKLRRKKLKITGNKEKKIVIIDFSDKTLKLPNGDIIKREDIVSYDQSTHTLLYKAPNGELRTIELPVGESVLNALFKSIAKKEKAEKERSQLLTTI